MNYLIFDTETTGLPRDWNAPVHKLDNWPRLVQLAWILYDEQGKEQLRYSKIVKPDGYAIPSSASAIHGITTEKANREGVPIADLLDEFCKVLNRESPVLVAHNISFDEKIVGAELLRLKIKSNFFQLPKVCTMRNTIDFCNLPNKKYPKLEELYYMLFHTKFKEAHHADIDAVACGECFFELKKKKII